MAPKIWRNCLLSVDFELKNPNEKISYASAVGSLLIQKFGQDLKEINGVFRASIDPIKQSGFTKIFLNGPIDVNQRFGSNGGVAENDRVNVTIRGV